MSRKTGETGDELGFVVCKLVSFGTKTKSPLLTFRGAGLTKLHNYRQIRTYVIGMEIRMCAFNTWKRM